MHNKVKSWIIYAFQEASRRLIISTTWVTTGMLACALWEPHWEYWTLTGAFFAFALLRMASNKLSDKPRSKLRTTTYNASTLACHVALGLWCYLASAFDSDAMIKVICFSMAMTYVVGTIVKSHDDISALISNTIIVWIPMAAGLLLYGNYLSSFFAIQSALIFLGMSMIAVRLQRMVAQIHDAKTKALRSEARAKASLNKTKIMARKLRKSQIAEATAIETRNQHLSFLATMSHEIRTPLNGVVSALELIKTASPERATELADIASSSADALLEIVGEVLELSRVEACENANATIEFDPRELIQSVHDALFPLALQKGLVLSVHIDDSVPGKLLGRSVSLRQVLVNLTGNALKYTETGSVEISMRLLTQSEERCSLELTVLDSGKGIAEDDLPYIFNPYFRASQPGGKEVESSGLGLAIAKNAVERLGGTIECESQFGKGTCFTVILDAERCDRLPDKASLPSNQQTPTLNDNETRPLHVLLVEDTRVNAMLVQQMLEEASHEVTWVDCGLSAVEAAQKQNFDVILMDIMLPDIDGVEACKRIRAQCSDHPPAKIVAFTANALQGDEDEYLSGQFEGYLAKPVRKAQLLELLANRGTAQTVSDESGVTADRSLRQAS